MQDERHGGKYCKLSARREMFHKVFKQGEPQITDFLQTAEQRQGMDAIDKFAKSKAIDN